MSMFPGYTLEELIEDTFYDPDLDVLNALVKFYEPWRGILERRLESWEGEEENGSWRDFKYYAIWHDIPDPPQDILRKL